MPRKVIPFNIFIERFKSVAKDEYVYIGGYTRMSKKIKVKHIVCDYEYEVLAANFISIGQGCPHCYKTNIKSQLDFEKEIDLITKGEYCVVGKYTGNKKPISVKHNKCGRVFETQANIIKRGSGCPYCTKKHRRYTIQEHQDIINNIYGTNSILVMDNYINNKPKLKIRCLECNDERTIDFIALKRGKFKCSNCRQIEREKIKNEKIKNRIKKEEVRREKMYKLEQQREEKRNSRFIKYISQVEDIHGDSLTILEKRYNTTDKFEIRCNTCSNIFNSDFKHLREGKGCPWCAMSKGERKISMILDQHNKSYEREYSFKETNISSLRFDFAVFDEELKCLIEFDGEQHFSVDKQFGDNDKEKKYLKLITNDKRKDKFCKENNIKLIRIPYFEYNNIEQILKNNNILQ